VLLLGVVGDAYNVNEDENKHLIGYILGVAVLISYLGCFPFFIVTAHLYEDALKTNMTLTQILKPVKEEKQTFIKMNKFKKDSKTEIRS
jgi:hypothetical protein